MERVQAPIASMAIRRWPSRIGLEPRLAGVDDADWQVVSEHSDGEVSPRVIPRDLRGGPLPGTPQHHIPGPLKGGVDRRDSGDGLPSIVQGPVACTSNPVVSPPSQSSARTPSYGSIVLSTSVSLPNVRTPKKRAASLPVMCATVGPGSFFRSVTTPSPCPRRVMGRSRTAGRAGAPLGLDERGRGQWRHTAGFRRPRAKQGWTRGRHRGLSTVEGVGAEAVGAEAVVAGADVARRRVRRRRMRPSKPASSSTMARADIGPVNESATVALPTEDASAAAGPGSRTNVVDAMAASPTPTPTAATAGRATAHRTPPGTGRPGRSPAFERGHDLVGRGCHHGTTGSVDHPRPNRRVESALPK